MKNTDKDEISGAIDYLEKELKKYKSPIQFSKKNSSPQEKNKSSLYYIGFLLNAWRIAVLDVPINVDIDIFYTDNYTLVEDSLYIKIHSFMFSKDKLQSVIIRNVIDYLKELLEKKSTIENVA